MDSKRKSNGNIAPAQDHNGDHSVKRIKLSRPASQYGETPKDTTQAGLELLEQLRNSIDKSGRAATVDFHTLPPHKGNEQYYHQTKVPIAFDTVERRLRNHEFASLSELESYLKRMVQNCKDYYPRESTIHKDAERIRKLTTSWMQAHNPAYRDRASNYAAYPTVITDELIASHRPPPHRNGNDVEADGEDVDMEDQDAGSNFDFRPSATPNPETPGSTTRKGRPPKSAKAADRNRRASSTPAPTTITFNGLTFQQAQEKILAEMTEEKEDVDDEIPKYDIFARLPDRKLFKDYYAVIPHPVSFATLKRGIKGGSSGATKFTTWNEFDEEVSLIWKNARHYNEDGSFISELAGDLEVFFNKRLRAAKKVVPEPQHAQKPQIKLKLNASQSGQTHEQAPTPAPRHTLRLNVVKDSLADSPALTPVSTTTNNSSVPHQRRSSTIARQSSLAAAPTPTSVSGNTDGGSSVSAEGDTITVAPVVKPEQKISPALPPATTVHQQPSATPVPLQLDGNTMAPPAAGAQQAIPMNGMVPNGAPMPVQAPPTPKPVAAPPIEFDSKWRLPGKNAGNALITKLHLSTHPGLNLRTHFHMDIPASEDRAQQSITINLPSTHYYLQITPTLSASISQRQFKTFAMAGSQRLLPMPQLPGQPVDQLMPLYEARLRTGVNMIEVTAVAAPGPDSPKGVPAELEKFTIFANLMRA